jgi:DNA-directed RNA polymerase specialized sigma24 family protein
MAGLYLLSLLLTADPEQAERCFVGGLDDCVNGNPVFKAWGYAWSRRAIIMNAIRAVFSAGSSTAMISTALSDEKWKPLGDSPLSSALMLEPFERFVFVMSLLEGYSDHECSVLLNRSRAEVASARVCALQHLGKRDSEMSVLK